MLRLIARLLKLLHGIVICREDLPFNPRWIEEHYPSPYCWEIDELFDEALKAGPQSQIYREARRIWWEAFWRLKGRYHRGRRFFDTYVVENGFVRRLEDREEWVLKNIVASGIRLLPPEAREYAFKPIRMVLEERGE